MDKPRSIRIVKKISLSNNSKDKEKHLLFISLIKEMKLLSQECKSFSLISELEPHEFDDTDFYFELQLKLKTYLKKLFKRSNDFVIYLEGRQQKRQMHFSDIIIDNYNLESEATIHLFFEFDLLLLTNFGHVLLVKDNIIGVKKEDKLNRLFNEPFILDFDNKGLSINHYT